MSVLSWLIVHWTRNSGYKSVDKTAIKTETNVIIYTSVNAHSNGESKVQRCQREFSDYLLGVWGLIWLMFW